MNALYYEFYQTSETSGLLPSNRLVWNNITSDLSNHEVVLNKMTELKHKAADAGEFEIITHDETFKAMFVLSVKKI